MKHLTREALLKHSEFSELIKPFLENSEYLKMDNYAQHLNTSRLQHSINVAYYTYQWAKSFGLDYVSATKGAMLHDFFLYNWQEENHSAREHTTLHPKNSLNNAKKHFDINNIVEDCIINHMWPMTLTFPKTKEGIVVQFADKYCASLEVGNQSYKLVKFKTLGLLAMLAK